MALFDKLKEKVNEVADIDKLSKLATNAVDSIKSEVAKAVDPSIKEKERLEKEKALQEQINAFFSSINLDEEIDYIFSVLKKSGASASNFEKGVDHLLSKTEAPFKKEEVLPALKKVLFARAFADNEHVIPLAVVIDYFMRDVVTGKLLTSFDLVEISNADWAKIPFVQALYGVAGRTVNYLNNGLGQKNYQTMTPTDFISIIENSNVLKSYTDGDPFAADEVRTKWAEDLCNSSLEIAKSSEVGSFLEKEEYVDALYFYTYIKLCSDEEDPAKSADITKIVNAYIKYLEACHNGNFSH